MSGKSAESSETIRVFTCIGGSFQYQLRNMQDLEAVLNLDPTVWAALCVPVSALNGDPVFFRFLDGDGNGLIRVDEVQKAVRWFFRVWNHSAAEPECRDRLVEKELVADDPDAESIRKLLREHAEWSVASSGPDLLAVRGEKAKLSSGVLRGNGSLSLAAVAGTGVERLYEHVVTAYSGADGITEKNLNDYLTEADRFLQWLASTPVPAYQGKSAGTYFQSLQEVAGKIDEYFRFCKLVATDPVHAKRFELDSGNLETLNLNDPMAVENVLESAPLAAPRADGILELQQSIAPAYRRKIETFRALFGLESLDEEAWDRLKAEFAEFETYWKTRNASPVCAIPGNDLKQDLAGEGAEILRKLFAEDCQLNEKLKSLDVAEKLLLFKKYLLDFTRNFVSFQALFDSESRSMMQAGRLVMDGHSYHLAVWIDNVAAHRAIAVRSNMCLLYLELSSGQSGAVKRNAAVAVTGGTLQRVYIGKPILFLGSDGVTYQGKVVEVVDGPISFGQTLLAPWRNLSSAIGNKLQKITDFTSKEKALEKSIEDGKLPQIPAANGSGGGKGFLSGGGLMLLVGSISVAAIGAAFSLVCNAISNVVVIISNMSWLLIAGWIACFLAVFLVPIAIYAMLKMRKRDLALFLEAGGWAINRNMRLNMLLSRFFTHPAKYPDLAVFILGKSADRKSRRISRTILVLVLLALIGWTGWKFFRCYDTLCNAPVAVESVEQ